MGINTRLEKAVVQTASNPAALTAEALTDNSGGTASQTIAAIGAAYNQAEVRNAVASLADEINKLIVDVTAIRTKSVASIADLSSLYDVVNAGE